MKKKLIKTVVQVVLVTAIYDCMFIYVLMNFFREGVKI